MPWKVRKRKCRQRDGDKGKYVVVKVKRGGGTKQSSCHTTKNLAKRATRARYASAYGESVMKITAGQLRQIIKEELGSLNEQHIPQDMLERLNSAMMSIAEFVMDKYDDDSAEGIAETEAILTDELNGFMESLEDMAMSRPPGDDLKPAPDNDMDVDNDGMISADELRDEIEDIRDDL